MVMVLSPAEAKRYLEAARMNRLCDWLNSATEPYRPIAFVVRRELAQMGTAPMTLEMALSVSERIGAARVVVFPRGEV